VFFIKSCPPAREKDKNPDWKNRFPIGKSRHFPEREKNLFFQNWLKITVAQTGDRTLHVKAATSGERTDQLNGGGSVRSINK